MEHKHSLGRPLTIGRNCIYIDVFRSSYNLKKVKIVDFTPKMVKITGDFYSWEQNPKCVSPHNLTILSEEGVDWDESTKATTTEN